MTDKKFKILMAPMNFANQPFSIVKKLQAMGHDARHVQYFSPYADNKHRFYGTLDIHEIIPVYGQNRFLKQFEITQKYINENIDVFHFWQKSFIFDQQSRNMTGLDLPLIKASCSAKIIHRFTGFDLRLYSWDMARNPYSPYRYGFKPPFDENIQKKYIDFIAQYVDKFHVQDPELQQFMPDAHLIPRGLDLKEWSFVGIEKNDVPTIVHAPTNDVYKGSAMILKALQDLKDEGLKFNLQILRETPHEKAKEIYKKADIIIDQILIGSTGVLTLEAWALGKPCVTYLREDLFKPFYGDDLGVANANPDNIKDVLRQVITDQDYRFHLSKRGREIVETFHDMDKVAVQFVNLYDIVTSQTGAKKHHPADLSFITHDISTLARFNPVKTAKTFLKKIYDSPHKIKKHGIRKMKSFLRIAKK